MPTGRIARRAFASILSLALVIAVGGEILAQNSEETPATPTLTVLHKFGTKTDDPMQLIGQLAIAQGRDGDLYSTSVNGGTSNKGTMFKVAPSGPLSVVYNFDGDPGNNPYSGVTLGTDGDFYGTTPNSGRGAAYKLTSSGVITDLSNFEGTGDGACPHAAPIQATTGNFYGTTVNFCGSHSTVYKLTSTGTLTTIYTWTDGTEVNAQLVQGTDGNLYGVNDTGGKGYGYIFKMTPSGTLTVLHDFAGTDGSLAPQGGTALIEATDGNFYGVAYPGGTSNDGVIFRITPSGTYTVLHNLNGTTDGSIPGNALVQATNGVLYGETQSGGSKNFGTIYSITTSGTFVVLHNFVGTDGATANSPLKQNTNGLLYGDTSAGGDLSLCGGSGCGVFYSLNIGAAPFINLSTYSGNVGSTVGIFGQDFDSASVVKFNGVKATKIVLSGTTYITATVPAGATDGRVTVTTGTTTLTSTKTFIVHNTWSSGKTMPTAVNWPAAGVINGKVYVVGGYTGGPASSANQIYSPATNTWSTGASIPAATAQAAAAVVDNILYVFGGSDNGGGTVFNTVWAYNPATNKWSTKSAMPTARCSAAAVVSNNVVYVIGGYNGSRLDTVEAFNPSTDTWTEKAKLINGKSEITAGLVGSTIVAADGFTSSGDTGDNEAYDIATNKWSALAGDPTARNGSCSGVVGSLLYGADGNTGGNGPVSLVESFSLSANKWTTLAVMPQTATDMGSAAYGGQLYCFGGGNNAVPPNNTVYNYVQIYQP